MQTKEMITPPPGMKTGTDGMPHQPSLVLEGLKAAWAAVPADMGAGQLGKMARLGLAELQMAIYPESNVGLPPVVAAGALGHQVESPLDAYERLAQDAQDRPAQEPERGMGR